MQWLNELPFADNRVFQIGFLAACGIAALIVLAIFYRLAFAHRLRVPSGRTRQPRLGLVDAFSLDGQRQLVLVRRDNIEHLVMIGGPNDVLVESQINRAAALARESNQVSPLLAPTTPARRTEPAMISGSAAPEPPAMAAAKVPAAPPVPAAPIAAPSVAKAPAPAQPTAPVSAQASIPARPDAAAPATTKAAEPARSPPRQAEPRPAQARAAMPPPIIPANASPNRGAPVRVTETGPVRGPGNSSAPSPVAPAPLRRIEKAEPAAAGSKPEPAVATVKTEQPAASAGTTAPLAGAAAAQARSAPKTPGPATASDSAQKSVDARPPADTTAVKSDKPPGKVDDPFDDLDSLETEMARLLGREKFD